MISPHREPEQGSLSENRHGERRTRARRVVCFSSQRPYPSALFEALMTFPDLSALSQRGVGGKFKGTRPEDAPTSPRRRTRALAQNAEEGWGACATADMFPAVLHSSMSAVPGVQCYCNCPVGQCRTWRGLTAHQGSSTQRTDRRTSQARAARGWRGRWWLEPCELGLASA